MKSVIALAFLCLLLRCTSGSKKGLRIEVNEVHEDEMVPNTNEICGYPKHLPNSQLSCVESSTHTTCNQTCMWGHTFSEGRVRVMTCIYSQGMWSPSLWFEECSPYVDCTISLGPGGKKQCLSRFMTKGPTCSISCQRYEDKPAMPMRNYTCNIKGEWMPKLPFCAAAGTGLHLLSPPLLDLKK